MGDFVRFSGKEGRFGQLKQFIGGSAVLEIVDTSDKVKNQHVHPLIPEEVFQSQKRVEVTLGRIEGTINVLNLSEFCHKYYDFPSRSFNTENIILSGDLLLR